MHVPVHEGQDDNLSRSAEMRPLGKSGNKRDLIEYNAAHSVVLSLSSRALINARERILFDYTPTSGQCSLFTLCSITRLNNVRY